MSKLALHWQIIIGLVAGIIWAVMSSVLGWSEFTLNWIDPFGVIFINLLTLIAVPLVLFSIISGISGLSDTSSLGRMGIKTLVAYLVTTVFAITIGLTLVNTIKPGKLVDEGQRRSNRVRYELWVVETQGVDKLDDRNLLQNLTEEEKQALRAEDQALAENSTVQSEMESARKTKDAGPLQFVVDMVPSNIFFSLNDNGLMLQVIFFSIFFGVTLLYIPPHQAKPVIDFINGSNEVFLKMVDIVMKGAPFFVFALLAGKLSEMAGNDLGAVIEIFKGLGWYSLTVVLGLAIMIFVVYPFVMMVIVKRRSYREFFNSIGAAQILAFSTSSSAATLPVTMECVQDNLGVSEKVTSFVLPIGATVNMDGTSLYQAVAVIFLAQFHMVDLTVTQQLTIVLTTTLASIGSAAVPSAGLVMLSIVLESIGLNPAWIAIIFPVDRILDMCRTVVNVTGDATVSTIIASTEGELE
ncbi:MAG: dicarboxylate/amino acid:cation symporter [Flavobacteriales bacterium]|nr:dicarboxylate/amino acid:cation symporter [Flavobacteriales bacterium]